MVMFCQTLTEKDFVMSLVDAAGVVIVEVHSLAVSDEQPKTKKSETTFHKLLF